MNIYFLGIGGGSAAGKTTFTEKIIEPFKDDILLIKLDNYYKHHWDVPKKERYNINFDCPESFDIELLSSHIEKIENGKSVDMPVYDFRNHIRKKNKTIKANPKNVVIIEGITALCYPEINEKYFYKVFVYAPSRIRKKRREERDIRVYGDTVEMVREKWKYVSKMHKEHIYPTMFFANRIVQGWHDNKEIDTTKREVKSMQNLISEMLIS